MQKLRRRRPVPQPSSVDGVRSDASGARSGMRNVRRRVAVESIVRGRAAPPASAVRRCARLTEEERDRRGVERPRHQVTLHLHAAIIEQQAELRRPLDALRRDLQAEAVTQPDDGTHDRRRATAVVDRRDQAAIDLDARQRQALQRRERGVAGAEVVERDADAQFTQLVQRRDRASCRSAGRSPSARSPDTARGSECCLSSACRRSTKSAASNCWEDTFTATRAFGHGPLCHRAAVSIACAAPSR